MLKSLKSVFLAAALVALLPWAIISFAQETTLSSDQEIRARALFSELRCVVCQNQSIDSSDADVAKDLRQIVREQIDAGKTDDEVREFLVARYGEFILLKPSFGWHTALLWGAPILLLLGGALIALRAGKAQRIATAGALSQKEEQDLAQILKERE